MRDPSELVWLKIYDHMFWMSYETYGVRFGESDENSYNFDLKLGGFLTIFDSGTSTVYVPSSLWKGFINTMKEYANVKFDARGHFLTYACKPENFPNIYLQVNGYWIEFRPEDYLLDASDNNDRSFCIFAFTQNTDEFWLLGDVFYRGYYVIHDDLNAKIGIAPHSTSHKKALLHTDYIPSKTLQNGEWSKKKQLLVYGGIPVAIILVILFFLLLWPRIWKFIKDPPKQRNTNSNLLAVFILKDD